MFGPKVYTQTYFGDWKFTSIRKKVKPLGIWCSIFLLFGMLTQRALREWVLYLETLVFRISKVVSLWFGYCQNICTSNITCLKWNPCSYFGFWQHNTLTPRYSEFCNIVNYTQLPFWGFTKHFIFDIVNYSI